MRFSSSPEDDFRATDWNTSRANAAQYVIQASLACRTFFPFSSLKVKDMGLSAGILWGLIIGCHIRVSLIICCHGARVDEITTLGYPPNVFCRFLIDVRFYTFLLWSFPRFFRCPRSEHSIGHGSFVPIARFPPNPG